MQVDSTNNYADIIQSLIAQDVNQIRKTATLEELGVKLAMAQGIASEIMAEIGNDFQIDDIIPEDSTVSYHV